jgi:hypothetical protein
MIRHVTRRAWIEVEHAAVTLGYWLRPYDMLADARRWFWQPQQRCGWPAGMSRAAVAEVVAAVRHENGRRESRGY